MTAPTTPGGQIRSDIDSFARDLSALIAADDRDGAATRLERELRADRPIRIRVHSGAHLAP